MLADWLRLAAGCTMMAWAAMCYSGARLPGRRVAVAGWSVLMVSGHGGLLFAAATPLCLSGASRPFALAMMALHLAVMLLGGGTIAFAAGRLRTWNGNQIFTLSLLTGALVLLVT